MFMFICLFFLKHCFQYYLYYNTNIAQHYVLYYNTIIILFEKHFVSHLSFWNLAFFMIFFFTFSNKEIVEMIFPYGYLFIYFLQRHNIF